MSWMRRYRPDLDYLRRIFTIQGGENCKSLGRKKVLIEAFGTTHRKSLRLMDLMCVDVNTEREISVVPQFRLLMRGDVRRLDCLNLITLSIPPVER